MITHISASVTSTQLLCTWRPLAVVGKVRPSKDARMINTSSSASEVNTIFQTLLVPNHQMVRAADTGHKTIIGTSDNIIDDGNQADNDEHCGDADEDDQRRYFGDVTIKWW